MDIRQPLVAGNWKLNGSRSSVIALSEAVSRGVVNDSVEVLVCPSFVHLSDVLGVLGNTAVRLGAQDCSEHETGAFTGETAAAMLVEFGCEYVIVGHSERRQLYAESNEVVSTKFMAVQNAGLTPIVCVGETLAERDSGNVQQVINAQLDAVFGTKQDDGKMVPDPSRLDKVVVAYEPVWAIGTGKTATPAEAQEVHAMIRARLSSVNEQLASRLRILYGGSVNPGNAEDLFSQPDIDGGLIGGASLKPDDFLAICQAAGPKKYSIE